MTTPQPKYDAVEARHQAVQNVSVPLFLTRVGLVAERLTRCFWPVWTVLFLALAAVFMGAHESAAVELVWVGGVLVLLALAWFLVRGIRRFRPPSVPEAIERLDSTMPGRPLKAMMDIQAIGAEDPASKTVWAAHVVRMSERTKGARAVEPDLRISGRDPFALRYVALTAFVVALLFGSVWRVSTLGEAAAGGPNAALAAGPTWEGWVEPPAYTGKPSLYLADIGSDDLRVPQGSRLTVRLYGEVGALTVAETVSGRPADEVAPASDPIHSFTVTQAGTLVIDGPGGRTWNVVMEPDAAPKVQLSAPMDRAASGEMQQAFIAEDDFAVVRGSAQIMINLDQADRRFGLAADPEPREPIVLDLPMTISGDRAQFEETLIDDLSKHPWANLPVTLQLTVEDDLGQTGQSALSEVELPGRRFFDPLARALIEQRRDLLWTTGNAPRVVQIMRAITHKPEGLVRDASIYLQLRTVMRRLEAASANGLAPEDRDELAEALWQIALSIEEGDLSDALDRLRRAQDRLSEAIRNGASEDEIAQLMDEMRQAMQDYMRQLAQQNQQQNGEDQQQAQNQGDTIEMTQQDLQDMLDRLQELMEQGRTAEAQQLLDQMMQMMQNMQVTQGQGQGQGQQSPGQQAMEGLADTLRDQQGLSDEAFRDLQEQFNPNAQAGESQQNQGRDGGQGRGQEHSQQQGEGQGQGQQQQQPGGQGQAQNQPNQQQDGQGGGGSGDLQQDLADRQRALRQELNRQQSQLPNLGGEAGEAARRSLDEAGEAMDRAEESLRGDDLAEAIDNQAEAMEALREGMRNLGEAMAENQQQQQGGQQGNQVGQANPNAGRDPLGRDRGSTGPMGTEEQLLQGDDVYRRARDLLDEIRKRSSETNRPEIELDYLRRLLDRF